MSYTPSYSGTLLLIQRILIVKACPVIFRSILHNHSVTEMQYGCLYIYDFWPIGSICYFLQDGVSFLNLTLAFKVSLPDQFNSCIINIRLPVGIDQAYLSISTTSCMLVRVTATPTLLKTRIKHDPCHVEIVLSMGIDKEGFLWSRKILTSLKKRKYY